MAGVRLRDEEALYSSAGFIRSDRDCSNEAYRVAHGDDDEPHSGPHSDAPRLTAVPPAAHSA